MRHNLLPLAVVATLSACAGVDEPAAADVVARFHTALNAGDWAAIDGMLSQSTRKLRPGTGTARAFRNIIARHGHYVGGELAGITDEGGRITIAWAARYDKGPVSELFVLVDEGGRLKIDSYTDNAVP
jgi:hypothetical protein